MGRELCLSRKLETAKQAAQCLSRADSSLLDLCALSSVWLLPGQEVGENGVLGRQSLSRNT